MSKSHVKHMSAESADKFEENIEGEDFGTLNDWQMELGLKILKVEEKIMSPAGLANVPVRNLLVKHLATYNAALMLLDQNPKMAVVVGNEQGGLAGIIAYITKQAVEDVAKAETREFSNMVMEHLPGYQLSRNTPVLGGFVGNQPAVGARVRQPVNGRMNVPKVDGSKLLAFA